MRFKLIPRFLLFAGLCVCLTSGELWLKYALATHHKPQIVFHSKRDGNPIRLTNTAKDDYPSWSPNGRRIVYWGEDEGKQGRQGFFQIYVMGADGRNRVRLTHNREHHWLPAWSPDGRTIAYVSAGDRRLIGTIHLMTADGQYLKQLSDVHNGGDYWPDFGPVGLAVSPASKTAAIWGRLKKLAPNLR